VLGAGLGTRLRPLTNLVPKPLFPIFGKPVITFAMDHLIACGVERFVINAHHLSHQFLDLFGSGFYRDREVHVMVESALLETGGGIKDAADLIGEEPFYVYSGDILTDVDLERLVQIHFSGDYGATLALRKTGLSADISFKEEDGLVVDVRQTLSSGIPGNFDFANISIWTREAVARIPAGRKISFIPVLVDWIGTAGRVGGVELADGRWFNIGNRSEYLGLHKVVGEGGWRPCYLSGTQWPVRMDPSSQVAPKAEISADSWVGANCLIESGVKLRNAIVWPNSAVRKEGELTRCVVAGKEVETGIFADHDFV
jgi:mannose-1-phosphate guanylyltransferase